MSRSRPTSRDVAALAGVSVATVSYVVNGRDARRVGPETRERVLAAARELGYAPNTSARGLRRRRTERIALVVGAIGVPANDQLARDLHAAADEYGYGVITMVVDSRARADKAFELLRQHIADGAVVAAPESYLDPDALAALTRGGLPLVVLDNRLAEEHADPVEARPFDVVRTPEKSACTDAFDHLIRSGRRRIAYIGHRHDFAPGARSGRYAAYLAAHDRHGLERDRRLAVSGADDRVTGYRAAADLLRLPEPPDAIFASSDRAAISAIWAARDAELSVPRDVAVVGVGNLEEGLVTRPTLSTVGQTLLDYSGVAELLFDRIFAKEPPPGRELTLPWSFIRREST
ncbi:MAG TPA: LacI family DNA-binding transcriptional regulator [Actinopolymorphaceae bacterium]